MARPKKKHTDPQESMEDLLVNTVALYSFPYDDRDGERESELPSLREVADQLETTVLRVRKLLITAEYFSTAVSRQVQQMAAEGNSVEAVMRVAGLKRASVYSYLPYVGLAFNLEQTTVNADRHRLFRKRLKAVEALAEYAGTGVVTKCAEATGETEYLCKEDAGDRYGDLEDEPVCHSNAEVADRTDCLIKARLQDELECLWKAVLAFEGYPFRTAGRGKTPGLKFSYQVKQDKDGMPVGEIIICRKDRMPVGEFKVSRKDKMAVIESKDIGKEGRSVGVIKFNCKEKTITRATIELAYRRAKAMGGVVAGPEELAVFGASYLYPLLVRFGVIGHPK